MTRGSQQLKQGKYMFCLSKLDSLVWQTRTSGLARKTGTSSMEKWNIRFSQTEHIYKKILTIDFKHHTSIHSAHIR
jgi:hypothetical protein